MGAWGAYSSKNERSEPFCQISSCKGPQASKRSLAHCEIQMDDKLHVYIRYYHVYFDIYVYIYITQVCFGVSWTLERTSGKYTIARSDILCKHDFDWSFVGSGMQSLTFSRCPIIDLWSLKLELSHAVSIKRLRDKHYMSAWFARISLLHADQCKHFQALSTINNKITALKIMDFQKSNQNMMRYMQRDKYKNELL